MSSGERLWEVVGGGDKGGILVRYGQELGSPQLPNRLATGSVIEQVELVGERLNFRRRTGEGPETGWVSLRLPNGKPLLSKSDGRPTASASAVAASSSASSAWPTHPLEEQEWEERLEPPRYAVLREKETEPGFSGEYNKFWPAKGHFKCAGCETPLYSAASKMREGCGWPAFGTCLQGAGGLARVVGQVDWTTGGREALCRRCGGHLGHVFMDGAPHRHCVNSLSLVYDEADAPAAYDGGPAPPAECLVDLSTFKAQLEAHSKTGSYEGAGDPGHEALM